MYPVEVLNVLNPCGMPPHKLVLKEGAPVVFLRNMSRSNGIMNGTRAIVTKCYLHRVQVRLTSGPKAGQDVAAPRINLQSPDNGTLHINFTRRQFPLRLAFCMTINKSQGQTFKNVGVWLPSPVFSHGQLYVALSRLRDPNGLCIASQPTMRAGTLVDGVVNIVWSELIPPRWNAELPLPICTSCGQFQRTSQPPVPTPPVPTPHYRHKPKARIDPRVDIPGQWDDDDYDWRLAPGYDWTLPTRALSTSGPSPYVPPAVPRIPHSEGQSRGPQHQHGTQQRPHHPHPRHQAPPINHHWPPEQYTSPQPPGSETGSEDVV